MAKSQKGSIHLLSIKFIGLVKISSGSFSTSVCAIIGSGSFGLDFKRGCVKSAGKPILLRSAAAVTPVLS